ncbi:MAG TPA: glycosyltransferase family 2 protein [Solirubrobacterales bacterium]|nr:glycosyltransferase family 2 protein [Solirubrobacterales bacterium]
MAPGGKRARNSVDKLVSPYVNGLADHISRVQDSVLDLHARLNWIEQELHELPKREERILARIDEVAAEAAVEAARVAVDRQMLQAIYERADEQRLRLYELRRSEEYELAFTEAEPLVSVVIPTYNRHQLLGDRCLPALLGQNYQNLEVIVSGDRAVDEIEAVVRDCGDPRVRYINRAVNGPYPDDPQRAWMMRGTPPMNDGVAVAKGRWISIVCDDDEVTLTHAERLVAAAQEQRLEMPYGRLRIRFDDGGELDWENDFPPSYGHFTLQLAIYHAGLRFFQYEPTAMLYGEPNDWSLLRRLIAAGVRIGRIDDLVVHRYEDLPTPGAD